MKRLFYLPGDFAGGAVFFLGEKFLSSGKSLYLCLPMEIRNPFAGIVENRKQ